MWNAILHASIPDRSEALEPEEALYLQRAAAVLRGFGEMSLTEETWSAWLSILKQETGRKGFALAHPLRVALTGRNEGPEMKKLLPLIGRELALKRLTQLKE